MEHWSGKSFQLYMLLFHLDNQARVIYTAIESLFAANAVFKLRKAKRFSSCDNPASTVAFRDKATIQCFALFYFPKKSERSTTRRQRYFSQINKRCFRSNRNVLFLYLNHLHFSLHFTSLVFFSFLVLSFGYFIL